MRLEGKAGVITGATSGLGLETLRAMTAEGANIVAIGRDPEKGKRAVEEMQGNRGRAVFHQGDVTDEQTIIDAIAHCRAEFGTFNIMHNNAGNQGPRLIDEASNAEWDECVATNLTAVFWGCKHAVIAMRESGGGSIINTASILSFTADPFAPVYCTTKSALLGLTRAVALAYIGDGIRCNCLCPGDFESPMLTAYFDDATDSAAARREMEEVQPGKRIAHPREIAPTAVFLASDESIFVNGTSIVVDGAMLARCY